MDAFDFTTERPIRLREAARAMIRLEVPSMATLTRWVKRGVHPPGAPRAHRVRLQAVRIGGRIYTSAEAMQRFVDALNHPHAPARPARQREASVLAASANLEAAGY